MILLVAYVMYLTSGGKDLNLDSVSIWLRSLHPATARVGYIVIYLIGTLLFLPGTALSFVGAIMFGPYQGTLYTWIGACMGASLAFLFTRWLGRELIVRWFGEKLRGLDAYVKNQGFVGILLLRLLPVFPFNLINFGSGLTAVRFRDYLIGTMIGILPGTFVYQFLFAKVGRRLLTDGLDWRLLQDSELLLPLGLFLVFLVGSSLLGRRIRHRSTTPDSQRTSHKSIS